MSNNFMKFLKNKKGESLIETIISISLFAIYSATIFGIITSALEFNQTAAEESEYFQEEILPVAEMKTYSDVGGAVQFEIVDDAGTPITNPEGEPIVGTEEVYMFDNSQGYIAFSPEVNDDPNDSEVNESAE